MGELDKHIYFALNKVYLTEFEKRTPRKSGITANAWDLIDNNNGTFSFVNPYGEVILYLEEGTEPHIIKPKNKKALRWKNTNNISIFAKWVNHPGTAARKFVESIVEDESLYHKFEEVLWQRIQEKFMK